MFKCLLSPHPQGQFVHAMSVCGLLRVVSSATLGAATGVRAVRTWQTNRYPWIMRESGNLKDTSDDGTCIMQTMNYQAKRVHELYYDYMLEVAETLVLGT